MLDMLLYLRPQVSLTHGPSFIHILPVGRDYQHHHPRACTHRSLRLWAICCLLIECTLCRD